MNHAFRTVSLSFALVIATTQSLAAPVNSNPSQVVSKAIDTNSEALTAPKNLIKSKITYPTTVLKESDTYSTLRILKAEQVQNINKAGVGIALLGVAAAVASGGYSPGVRTVFVSRDDFPGVHLPIKVLNPLNDVNKGVQQAIAKYIEQNPKAKEIDLNQYTFDMGIRRWILLYPTTSTDENKDFYEINFSAIFSMNKSIPIEQQKSIGLFGMGGKQENKNTASVGCKYVSDTKPYSVWSENNFALVEEEKAKIVKQCIDEIVPEIPKFLEMDLTSQIKVEKVKCKEDYKVCIVPPEGQERSKEQILECKAKYNQCQSSNVRPLVLETPIGKCKDTLNICYETAKQLPKDSDEQDDALSACKKDYKICVKSTVNQN